MEPGQVRSVTVVNRKTWGAVRFKNVEVRAGMEQVPSGFSGQQLGINTVCGGFEGPGTDGGVHKIECGSSIPAKYVTLQILEDDGMFNINEVIIEMGTGKTDYN